MNNRPLTTIRVYLGRHIKLLPHQRKIFSLCLRRKSETVVRVRA
jgi:hypothetical protein